MKKYKLIDRSLVLKNQDFRRIVPKSQFYPLMYIYYNDPMVGYIEYKKTLQKLTKRYYWPRIAKDVDQYIQAYYQC